MANRRRKKWKNVPRLTPFERGRTANLGQLIKEGIDPRTVTVSSGLGSYTYSYQDVANYCELSHQPFNQTVSLFALTGESNEKHARARAVQ